MITPSKVNSLRLVDTSFSITDWENSQYLSELYVADKNKIGRLIKKHLPGIYEVLGLEFHNPYKYYKKDDLLVVFHTSIQFYLKYT